MSTVTPRRAKPTTPWDAIRKIDTTQPRRAA